MESTVTMIQRTKYRWDLIATKKGHVLVEGMYHASPNRAEEWCRAYLSTWPNWTYRIILKE